MAKTAHKATKAVQTLWSKGGFFNGRRPKSSSESSTQPATLNNRKSSKRSTESSNGSITNRIKSITNNKKSASTTGKGVPTFWKVKSGKGVFFTTTTTATRRPECGPKCSRGISVGYQQIRNNWLRSKGFQSIAKLFLTFLKLWGFDGRRPKSSNKSSSKSRKKTVAIAQTTTQKK